MAETRKPQAFLTIAGQTVTADEVSAKLSRDGKSDTLSATAALYGGGPDADFWSSANNMDVQCTIDSGAGASGLVFDGVVDTVECDFSGGKVSITARDKAAKMIDKKSGKKHLNKQPEQIVQDYAGQSGLPAEVDSVSDKAGRIVQIDYVALAHRISDWGMVQHIADTHGMSAYATLGKLYFKKIPEDLPVIDVVFTPPTPFSMAAGNQMTLVCRRNVGLGKTVNSHVHSWNHKDQKKYEASATEAGGGDTLDYHHHHPGLTQDQANKRAKAHLDKTTQHELNVHVELPGDPTITARFNLQLSGTNSAWDQVHEIDSVEHKISFVGGYVTSIDTKAKSKRRGG